MLKFMLASRSKPEHTKERYYFEWGIIHVALMVTTPTVVSTFRRYAQHFVPDGLDGDRPVSYTHLTLPTIYSV